MLNKKQQRILEETKRKEKKAILFVCLGNICRSPAAEGVMKSMIDPDDVDNWYIDSAGTGRWHIGELPDKRMRVHAQRRGLSLQHHCRQIKESDFNEFDIIIGMDNMNIDDMRHLAPSIEAADKIFPMAAFVDKDFYCDHIPDPYYSGAEGFEHVLDLLENGCTNLYRSLK